MTAATSLLESPPLDEAAVLRRVRRGDRHAYGMLYERHLASARRVAGSLLRDPADVDDVVAEAFASAFATMRRGRGPVDAFAPYIHSCVRNECRRSWSRERGRIRTQGDDAVVEAHSIRRDGRDDEFGDLEENDVVRAALDAMPPRLRAVLWHTEVDNLSHATIARMTGSTPQAVAALAMRARRAFADRYLQAHLAADDGDTPTTECHKVRRGLAEVVRGSASARRCRATSEHLATCSACAAAQGNLTLVNERLRTVPLFALVTGRELSMLQLGAKARLLSWLAGPAVELAAAGGLALVVALAPAATTPPSADAASPVVEQNGGASPADVPAMAPVIIPAGDDPAGRAVAEPAAEPVAVTGVTGAATTPARPADPQHSSARRVIRGSGDDLAVSSAPTNLAPGAIAAAAIGGSATQPAIAMVLPAPSAILNSIVGAVVQAAIDGGLLLPLPLPLPSVAVPEVTVAAELTDASVAAAVDVVVPLPPVPPTLESVAPIDIDTPSVSVGSGAGSGQGTGANAGISVNTGSGSDSSSSSGSSSGSVGVDVSVGGGNGGDAPVVEIEIDVPIISAVDPGVVIGGGGLLPGP